MRTHARTHTHCNKAWKSTIDVPLPAAPMETQITKQAQRYKRQYNWISAATAGKTLKHTILEHNIQTNKWRKRPTLRFYLLPLASSCMSKKNTTHSAWFDLISPLLLKFKRYEQMQYRQVHSKNVQQPDSHKDIKRNMHDIIWFSYFQMCILFHPTHAAKKVYTCAKHKQFSVTGINTNTIQTQRHIVRRR